MCWSKFQSCQNFCGLDISKEIIYMFYKAITVCSLQPLCWGSSYLLLDFWGMQGNQTVTLYSVQATHIEISPKLGIIKERDCKR